MADDNDAFLAGLQNGQFETGNPAPAPIEGTGVTGNGVPHALPEGDVVGDDFLPSDKFQELDPQVQHLLKVRQRTIEKQERKMEKMEERLNSLFENQAAPARNAPEEPKTGWAQYSESDLTKYLADADTIQKAVLANPEDEAVRAEASKIEPGHLRAVQEELVRRRVEAGVNEKFEKLEARTSEERRTADLAAIAEAQIRKEVGPDALLDSTNPVMVRARELYEEMTEQFPVSDPAAQAALAVMTMRQANQEVNKGPTSDRVPANILRALNSEGSSRRESSQDSERRSAAARGDWDTALQMDIDEMIRNM